MKTIIIQGAMHTEIEHLINMFPGGQTVTHHGYTFYETSHCGTRIIISRTEMGTLAATICTMLAIETYKPDLIINQGTAGAHLKELQVGDIIIGEDAVYINNTRSPARQEGQGSNALEWHPGKSLSYLIKSEPSLVKLASSIPYSKGKLLRGRLGTGDIFSKEVDRINLLNSQLGEICEDMESVAVYKACQTMNIPVIGIRIISNNEITGNDDVDKQFEFAQLALQEFIYDFIENLTKNWF